MLNPATLLRRTSSLAALGPEMHVNHQSMMEWAPADSNLAAILTMVGFMAFSGFLHDRPHGVSLLQLQLSSAIVARYCRSLLSLVSIVPVCLCASSQHRRAEEPPNMCRYGVQILHLDQGRPSEYRGSASNRWAFAYRDRFLRPKK